MTSTKITTNADALKRAARDIADRSGNISPNGVLNCLSAAIAGPGRSWGLLKGAPSGHFVQPGLEGSTKAEVPHILQIEGRPPMAFGSRDQAIEAFNILARHAINRDEACRELTSKGSACLQHVEQVDTKVYLTEFAPASSVNSVGPLHETPFTPLSPEVIEQLRGLVAQGRSMLVCGGTTTGTHDLVEQLARGIPDEQKVISIESFGELSLSHPRHHQFQISPDYPEWASQFVDHAFRALRMSPDWLITEAIRDGSSANAWLEVAITGHHTLATMHAAGTRAALMRLEDMLCDYEVQREADPIRRYIADGTDVIIYLSRIPGSSQRHIEVIEVRGYKDGAYDIAPIAL